MEFEYCNHENAHSRTIKFVAMYKELGIVISPLLQAIQNQRKECYEQCL